MRYLSKQVKCSYLLSFQYACLSHCNLSGANLSNCCLERADLSHANLEGAQLIGVKALCANMEGKIFFYNAFQLIILIKSSSLSSHTSYWPNFIPLQGTMCHNDWVCLWKKIWKTLSTKPDLNTLAYFAYGLPWVKLLGYQNYHDRNLLKRLITNFIMVTAS